MAAEAIDTKRIVDNAVIAFKQSYSCPNIKKALLYRVPDRDIQEEHEKEKLNKIQWILTMQKRIRLKKLLL